MTLINYQKIKQELNNRQKLIAVSKGQDVSKIKKLYDCLLYTSDAADDL